MAFPGLGHPLAGVAVCSLLRMGAWEGKPGCCGDVPSVTVLLGDRGRKAAKMFCK